MCSKPAVSALTRATVAATTMGGSEIARLGSKKTFFGNLARTPENMANTVTNSVGITKPEIPEMPMPETPAPSEDSPDAPPTPGSTTVDSLIAKKRKRQAALQGGILSTMTTGGAGLTGAPSLSTANAGGLKLKLGA